MKRICIYIKEWIELNRLRLPTYVYFSDCSESLVPIECEQVSYVNDNNNNNNNNNNNKRTRQTESEKALRRSGQHTIRVCIERVELRMRALRAKWESERRLI